MSKQRTEAKRMRALQRRAERAQRDELARLGAARGRLAVAAWRVGQVHAASIRASTDAAADLIGASDGATQRCHLTSTFPEPIEGSHGGITTKARTAP